MTSTTILPSVGPPPPNIRRPHVPEDLKPKINNPADKLIAGSRGRAHSRPEPDVEGKRPPQKPTTQAPGNGKQKQEFNSNSAVAVQVLEGRNIPENPATPPEASVPESVKGLQAPEEDLKRAGELSPEDESYVQELKARDREVRAHEAAHATAGSGYTGSPNFEYIAGPDGVQYAVGGHVEIDTSEVPNDPAATISKMEVVRRAALAPARPSGQDRAVAAAAEQAARKAQAELNEQRAAKAEENEATNDQSSGLAISKDQAVTRAGLVENAGPGQKASENGSVFSPQLVSIDLIA